MANVQKSVVLHLLHFTLPQNFLVNVEVEVQMVRRRLHAPDTPITIESRSAALAAKAGSAHFESHNILGVIHDVPSNHSFEGEAGRVLSTRLGPGGGVGIRVVLIVAKLWKREPESAEKLPLL